MDKLTAVVVLLPSILSTATACVYAYIAWKKSKEPPKDEIWETALKILCAKDDCCSGADDFARLYEELKFFKEHPEKLNGFVMISQAMDAYAKDCAEKTGAPDGSTSKENR